jgi:hypothetical protein
LLILFNQLIEFSQEFGSGICTAGGAFSDWRAGLREASATAAEYECTTNDENLELSYQTKKSHYALRSVLVVAYFRPTELGE